MAVNPALEQTEQEFDGDLFRGDRSLAGMLGWTSYHTLRSKGSASGFPDRVLTRERVIFAELKSEKGKPTADQEHWLSALVDAHAEVYLWKPSDLDEIGKILSHRGPPAFYPQSKWTNARCRYDQLERQAA